MSTFYGPQRWLQWKIGDEDFACEASDETLAIIRALAQPQASILDPATVDIHSAVAVADVSNPEYQHGPVSKLEQHIIAPVLMKPQRLADWHAFATRYLYAHQMDKD
jgi:hypothetical protein